jgi:zinc protease
VTLATLVPLLEKQFGGWKASGPAPTRVPVPMASQLTEGQITIVDMPGAAQSQIRIGWVGVPRATRDYFTLQVLNTILGGAFTSRLNQNLREEHGYTYGAARVSTCAFPRARSRLAQACRRTRPRSRSASSSRS